MALNSRPRHLYGGTEFILRLTWYTIYISSMVGIHCCPDTYDRFNTFPSCYYISETIKSWIDSRSFCQSQGGDLLIIDSQEELNILNSRTKKDKYYWIGLSDMYEEGDWRWVNGLKFPTNELKNMRWWAPRNPDNRVFTEDCVEYSHPLNSMNDRDCENHLYYICEKLTEQKACLHPWRPGTPGMRNCYKTVKAYTNWRNSRLDCQRDDANLLAINSIEELNWIRSILKEESMTRIWLGLIDSDGRANHSTWFWVDRTPLDISIIKWADGEPNGLSMDEDCALYNSVVRLIDRPCIYAYGFICEAAVKDKKYCRWPPGNMDMKNMDIKCTDPDTDTTFKCANLMDEGIMAEFRCQTNTISTTGIPIAYSICQSNAQWSNIQVFKCTT